MAGRSAVSLLVLVAFGCLAHTAMAVDGGKGCTFIDPRELTVVLKNTLGVQPTPAQYNTALNNLKRTNNYICKSCVAKGTQAINTDAIKKGYSQCVCDDTHGYYTYTIGSNPGKKITGWGCSKCPTGTKGSTTFTGKSNNAVGPYNPAASARTWSATPCLTQ